MVDPRRPSADSIPATSNGKKRKKGGDAPQDLGRALRTVYDETLREDVPSDFLDLLGKLD